MAMALDRNPTYGKDQSFRESAIRTLDLLWETTGGDLSAFPKSYLETLRHEFSDGNVSMLEVIDRVNLGPDATYEDYCEVREALMSVDYDEWPDPEDIVEVPYGHLIYEIDPSIDYSEVIDFAEEIIAEEAVEEEIPEGGQPAQDPLSEKMELFFKKVISSVYMDGVTEVTDAQGNPPNSSNNYLMSPDGTSFSGIFYDSPPTEEAKQYPFTITEGQNGKWSIKY